MGIGSDTWNYLRDSVKEFILVEATDGMQVGLVSFTNTATKVSDLVTLDTPSNRESLAGKVPNLPTEDTQTKNVAAGITKAKEVLGGEGMVILVTENMKSHSEDLVAAAGGTPVWPVLYPHLIEVSYASYQSLADASGASVFPIENNVVDVGAANIQSVDNRVALSRCLLDIQYQTQGDSLQEIVSSSCAGKECQISLEVPTNTNYQQTFHIEVYFTRYDNSNLKITVRDPAGTAIGKSFSQETGIIYTGSASQVGGTYTVDVSKEANFMDVKSSLLATLQTESGGYDIKLWSSLDLQHLEYTSNSAPTLFAMVGDGDSHVVDASVTATVTDSAQNTAVLVMRDDGTGADVTGNDGVYSAYLIGLSQTGSASVQVAANDNGGSAKLVTATRRAAPVDLNGQSCCGSQITFQTDLPSAGTFTLTSENAGEVTGTIPPNFPPGRVTDLRSSLTLSQVTLTFTAPGDDLDQGTAARYDVNFKRDDNNTITTYSSNETQEAGMLVTITAQLPDCDVLFHITVSATDSQSVQGKESNEVREMVSCSATETPPIDPPNPPTPLGTGAIVGIVIGVILFLVILAIGIYLFMNRDNLDDLWLWQMLTCRCLRKPKNDNLYNPPAPRSTRSGNDVIRNNKSSSSGPVRNLDDLYAKPDLTAKRNKKTDEDDGDGGFREHKSRVNNAVAMNNLGDSASTASTSQPYMGQSNASINQVGIPPYSGEPYNGSPQNYGRNQNHYSGSQYDQQYDQYDGQYYDEYGYSPQNDGHDNAGYTTNYDRVPAPRKIKSNTQV
nr:calcium-activated chloride channel regulator 4-like [Penaeus vannamei]